MKDESPVDRRKYLRLDLESKVDFQIKAQAEEEKSPIENIPGTIRNISVEGICFSSRIKLTPGTRLKLEIVLPSESEPLHLEGEVRWSQPAKQKQDQKMFDTGVKLFTVDRSDEGKFVGYVCDKMSQRLHQYLHL